jgi:hypothetical protein
MGKGVLIGIRRHEVAWLASSDYRFQSCVPGPGEPWASNGSFAHPCTLTSCVPMERFHSFRVSQQEMKATLEKGHEGQHFRLSDSVISLYAISSALWSLRSNRSHVVTELCVCPEAADPRSRDSYIGLPLRLIAWLRLFLKDQKAELHALVCLRGQCFKR